jgi:hypothetical protein
LIGQVVRWSLTSASRLEMARASLPAAPA